MTTSEKNFRNYVNECGIILGTPETVAAKYSAAGSLREFDAMFKDYVPGGMIIKAWSLAVKAENEAFMTMPIAEFNRRVAEYL